jgi:signal transduction histidine kinase
MLPVELGTTKVPPVAEPTLPKAFDREHVRQEFAAVRGRVLAAIDARSERDQAGELLSAVDAAIFADPGTVEIPQVASPPALEALRTRVVRAWLLSDPPPSGFAVLAIMAAFDSIATGIGDRVAEAAQGGAERTFSEWLTGPSGLELVVEVAHDLRSPLTSILFLAETIQREQSGPVTDLQKRQLGLVYSAALGLSTLASNVMELARGGTRLADDRPAPFSITDVLQSVADMVRPMAEEKGLTMRVLPPKVDHRRGPAQALSRVLLNLATNAIKFTEDGFVEVTAKATSLEDIEFSVRDSGHGITPEALATLFQPFRPGPKGDDMRFSGTGLGLALCRRLVGAMGSTLEFESDASWGTRFYFSLTLPAA